MHPIPGVPLDRENYDCTVVRWISDISGTIRIVGKFDAGDVGQVGYHIYKNNIEVLSDMSFGTWEFDVSLDFEVGDFLDFMVGNTYYFGYTPIYIYMFILSVNIECTNSPCAFTWGTSGTVS
jgi:hypothetical protein